MRPCRSFCRRSQPGVVAEALWLHCGFLSNAVSHNQEKSQRMRTEQGNLGGKMNHPNQELANFNPLLYLDDRLRDPDSDGRTGRDKNPLTSA